MSRNEEPVWLKVGQVAQQMQLSESSIYRMVSNKELPVRWLGGRIRIHKSFIDNTPGEATERTTTIFPSMGSKHGGPCPHPGAPRHYTSAREAIQRAARRAGLGHIVPHDLRHTCATLPIQKERCNIKEIMAHMRHSDAALTQRVDGHLYPEDLPAMAKKMEAFLTGHV